MKIKVMQLTLMSHVISTNAAMCLQIILATALWSSLSKGRGSFWKGRP